MYCTTGTAPSRHTTATTSNPSSTDTSSVLRTPTSGHVTGRRMLRMTVWEDFRCGRSGGCSRWGTVTCAGCWPCWMTGSPGGSTSGCCPSGSTPAPAPVGSTATTPAPRPLEDTARPSCTQPRYWPETPTHPTLHVSLCFFSTFFTNMVVLLSMTVTSTSLN